MAETEIRLEIVTPDSTVYSEIVDHVVVPTANGKIDLFQHHAPLIDRLVPSDIKVVRDGQIEYLAVGAGFVEVYAECSIDELTRRDVKGLYAKAISGEIKNFTGISDPYEAPENAEIVVNSETQTAEESLAVIMDYLESNGYIAAATANA